MSWRDYKDKDKKKKNILEDNDNKVNQQKYVPQATTSEEKQKRIDTNNVRQATQNILKQNQQNVSTWDKVKANASILGNDIGNIGKNFWAGTKLAGKNALYYIESMSENNSGEYRRYNQRQSALKEKQNQIANLQEKSKSENPDVSNITLPVNKDYKKDIKKLSEEEKNNVLLPKKQNSLMLESIDKSIQKEEEQIQKNVEGTSNKVLRKVAELTPSIAQSVTGMGASVVNPALRIRILANISWRWLYKRCREKWIYWKSSSIIWNYNG